MVLPEVGLVLVVAAAHLAIAKAFETKSKLNLLFVSLCLDHANAWYEYYLETVADRSKSPKKIEEVRQKAFLYLSDGEAIVSLHSHFTNPKCLLLGYWIGYVMLCATVWSSLLIMRATVRQAKIERYRHENLRA